MDGLDHEAGKKIQEVEQEEKKTQSQIIVGLASDMKFFYDEQGKYYAKVELNNHSEVWPIRSKNFRNILTIRYLNLSNDKDKAPGSQAMEDALKALEARAYVSGKQENAYVRVAETYDGIYIDLCNDEWQVIEINKKGWQLLNKSPVNFIRTPNMLPLPTPKDGDIESLKPFINYGSKTDFKLIIAWLLSTFKEGSPFPILTLQGEQGSAKSTTTKVLRALVDPSGLPLRALPDSERDMAIAANNTYILAFDNLSGFSHNVSDALCKMSTGGGLATRKLYSDDEEAVFQIMRPTILNGIDDIAKRQDLLDRSIVIDLPSISEEKRIDEGSFWKKFTDQHPYILGALCNVVSEALQELPNTNLKSKPRMADFALWVTASEGALNWSPGEFMDMYNANRDQAIDQGIESDPFAAAIVELMKHNQEWVGNASQLIAEAGRYADERTRNSKAFPVSRSVRNRLKRINPSLKKKGIHFEPYENKMDRTLKLSSLSSYRHEASSSKGSSDDDSNYDEKTYRHSSSYHDDVGKLSSLDKPHNDKANDDDYDNYDIRGLNSKNDMDISI